MFYLCVILLLAIIFLGKLYLNEKLEKENLLVKVDVDKFLYNKEIESLKKTNEEDLKNLHGQSNYWRFKYYAKCKVFEDEFEKKYAEEVWLKLIRRDYEEIKQWRDNILNIREDDEFLRNIKYQIYDGFCQYSYDTRSEYFTKVLQTFKEVETLKQELATQTANNIILKDELNK